MANNRVGKYTAPPSDIIGINPPAPRIPGAKGLKRGRGRKVGLRRRARRPTYRTIL